MDSKGQVRIRVVDIVVTIMLLVGFGIMAVSLNKAFSDTTDELSNSGLVNGTGEQRLKEARDSSGAFMDGFLTFIFLLLYLGSLRTSFKFAESQAFIIVFIIIFIILAFASAEMANVWEEVTRNGFLAGEVSEFPWLDWIFSNFVEVIIIIGMSNVLAMFASRRSQTIT